MNQAIKPIKEVSKQDKSESNAVSEKEQPLNESLPIDLDSEVKDFISELFENVMNALPKRDSKEMINDLLRQSGKHLKQLQQVCERNEISAKKTELIDKIVQQCQSDFNEVYNFTQKWGEEEEENRYKKLIFEDFAKIQEIPQSELTNQYSSVQNKIQDHLGQNNDQIIQQLNDQFNVEESNIIPQEIQYPDSENNSSDDDEDEYFNLEQLALQELNNTSAYELQGLYMIGPVRSSSVMGGLPYDSFGQLMGCYQIGPVLTNRIEQYFLNKVKNNQPSQIVNEKPRKELQQMTEVIDNLDQQQQQNVRPQPIERVPSTDETVRKLALQLLNNTSAYELQGLYMIGPVRSSSVMGGLPYYSFGQLMGCYQIGPVLTGRITDYFMDKARQQLPQQQPELFQAPPDNRPKTKDLLVISEKVSIQTQNTEQTKISLENKEKLLQILERKGETLQKHNTTLSSIQQGLQQQNLEISQKIKTLTDRRFQHTEEEQNDAQLKSLNEIIEKNKAVILKQNQTMNENRMQIRDYDQRNGKYSFGEGKIHEKLFNEFKTQVGHSHRILEKIKLRKIYLNQLQLNLEISERELREEQKFQKKQEEKEEAKKFTPVPLKTENEDTCETLKVEISPQYDNETGLEDFLRFFISFMLPFMIIVCLIAAFSKEIQVIFNDGAQWCNYFITKVIARFDIY